MSLTHVNPTWQWDNDGIYLCDLLIVQIQILWVIVSTLLPRLGVSIPQSPEAPAIKKKTEKRNTHTHKQK